MMNDFQNSCVTFGSSLRFLCMLCLLFAWSSCRNSTEQIAENEYYVCSMDPQVMEKHPGMCPICKMPLAKAVVDKSPNNKIRLSDEQVKLANIRLAPLGRHSMGKETVLNATFSINQNKTSVVSAKINGRIEKIYHNVTGEMVKEGEPLYDLYSRDLLLAQEELLLTSGKNGIAAKGLMRAAKNKLLLWGMSEAQVDKLMKTRKANEVVTVHSAISGTLTSISMREGDFVMEGQVLLQVSDLSSLWVEAQVYRNESSMTTGDDLLILPEAFPGDQVHGHHAYITPEAQGGGRFNLLRIEIDNAAGKYQPGMQATVVARSEMNETYALPVDAVIRSKDHAVAWVKSRDGSFEARMIGTGMENKDMIEITSGLGEGDSVVVSGAYLIHSEYVFKKGKQAMSDMKM